MTSSPRHFLSTAFLLAMVAGCGGSKAQEPASKAPATVTTEPGSVGQLAANFAAVDMDGVKFKLSDHRGRVVLINFFATWCAPCLTEMRHLRKIYEKNKDKGFLLVIVSLDGADTEGEWRAFGRRNKLNVPLILDGDLHISALFNPKKTAPLNILIDRSGQIVAVHNGYTPGDEKALAADVATAVGGSASTSN